ncbi:hypothetical protein NON08_11615 [Cetobacterium somerae]|uniref:hypothetical protein n=1 Tax=Cetobacterium sp. NK01 TaxID=2993530 RepID=UPI0021168421|nr:hypothetical protein [Cetobacterium sp. NK01]MCQ8213146.1 hypothetical protein [Cetobacterium sp. NK01]
MYVSKLSKLGYKLLPYESHFKFKGQEAIDIREEEENEAKTYSREVGFKITDS